MSSLGLEIMGHMKKLFQSQITVSFFFINRSFSRAKSPLPDLSYRLELKKTGWKWFDSRSSSHDVIIDHVNDAIADGVHDGLALEALVLATAPAYFVTGRRVAPEPDTVYNQPHRATAWHLELSRRIAYKYNM